VFLDEIRELMTQEEHLASKDLLEKAAFHYKAYRKYLGLDDRGGYGVYLNQIEAG